ncbi:MAG: hypothetical protein M3O36_21235 [Myxococcota bacterium]|nr:hypothetical protein [Myxococcota bacterium]
MNRCARLAPLNFVFAAFSCSSIAPTGASVAPANACPDHPCVSYLQSGAPPSCSEGVCITSELSAYMVLVVSLAEDAYFAPGRAYAVPYSHIFEAPAIDGCAPPACARLPRAGTVNGNYLIDPQTASLLNWNLGNAGFTALPVHVTYRMLWPPGAPPQGEASAVGLPLGALNAQEAQASFPVAFPGPAQGPSIVYKTYLQPATYERTIAPDPPFDRAFPPDVDIVTVMSGDNSGENVSPALDVTTRTTLAGDRTIPTFNLTRAEGLLGWTAYLRDATTKRVLSTVQPLSGTTATGVVLATSHHPLDKDALTNAELVMAPPVERAIPTGVFAPAGMLELPASLTYVSLPAPVAVHGTVASVEGGPVPAELVFEALGIDELGSSRPNATNFEFVTRVRTFTDRQGGAAYSVVLPSGQYRFSVRPLDAFYQITVREPFTVGASTSPSVARDVTVDLRRAVRGRASVADGRPLFGAMVDALPLSCFSAASQGCLPRQGETTTAEDGSFTLSLDPGGYELRVQPLEGTNLPWSVQPILVGSTPLDLKPIVVPAPAHLGARLADPDGNPVVKAIVRMFDMPARGPAIEVARTMTDSTGRYDLYVAPPQ